MSANSMNSVGLQDNNSLLLTDQDSFLVQEAYKALRTNVIYSLPGGESKCIGICSPEPGEGKSTTSVNLAIALAQIGKRVLLIDCDMRMSDIARRLHITMTPGLSDFLVGQSRIEDAVRNVEELGIYVLPAGSVPPEATSLLESKQMEHLFTAVRKIYDYVIVDLPPVTTVPDAAIMAKHIDGYLLVVRQKQTTHRKIVQMLKQLEMVNANIMGFINTSAQNNGDRYYRYKYK
jgi:capsular exopolysaccharide synthesis family protein